MNGDGLGRKEWSIPLNLVKLTAKRYLIANCHEMESWSKKERLESDVCLFRLPELLSRMAVDVTAFRQ